MPPDRTIASANGRIVYLAKPAGDMEDAYSRLALELQGHGYSVVPEASSDIPKNATALGYVRDALAKAELSIHVLGEKRGFEPDDETGDPIVKLQLVQAREKEASNGDQAERIFRRIIWAPKILDAGGQSVGAVAERDPLQVLARFDKQIATDKIDGDILGKFIEFLFQYLAQTAPPPPARATCGCKLEAFLSPHAADED